MPIINKPYPKQVISPPQQTQLRSVTTCDRDIRDGSDDLSVDSDFSFVSSVSSVSFVSLHEDRM